jgi:histidine triad (HIT) family protein
MDCIFCKIIAGEIPSKKVYEDEEILAFHDIKPMAPVHIMIIPKTHINGASDIDYSNSKIISKIFETIPQITKDLGIESFRVITNCGEDAGQTIKHLHFHILGGKKLPLKLA